MPAAFHSSRRPPAEPALDMLRLRQSAAPMPAQPHWAAMRARCLTFGGRYSLRGWFGFERHHLRAQLGVGCENAMPAQRGSAHFAQRSYAASKANQVQPRSGHQRSQPLHELQRRHHQVRGAEPGHKRSCGPFVPGEGLGHWPSAACRAVSPGGLELEDHLARGVGLHALIGQSRARDVAAQLLQRLAASRRRSARRRAG